MLKAFDASIYFTLSAALLLNTLAADEMPSNSLAASSKDSILKGTATEDCKKESHCNARLENCAPDVPSQLLYFKHIEAKGIGYKQGYSTVGAFLTPYTTFSNLLPFADLRGHVFNDGKFAANGGLGVKYLSDHPFVFGAGVYYDFRQVRNSHFNQVGLSLEMLARRWETRLNGYLPVGTTKHARKKSESVSYNFDHFAGHHLFYSQTFFVKKKTEFAMRGADAEFGWHLLKPREDYTLYAAAGPYYYKYENKHALGGKVRLEGRVTPYVTLEVSDSYDCLFHNIVQGQVSINIPFGRKIRKKNGLIKTSCSTALAMEARIMRPMQRQEIIVADKRKQHYFKKVDPVAQSIYGGPLNFIFVNADAPAGGNGTFESPYNDINYASTQSDFNDVIYISGDFTLSSSVDQNVILLQNQSLLGSGIAQTVPIQASPTTVANIVIPQMTATMPSITQGYSDNIVYIHGDNTAISGIQFNSSQNNTSVITNQIPNSSSYQLINNMTVANSNLSVLGAGAYGIYLRAVIGDILIQNNTINGNPNAENSQNGIYIEQFGPTGGPGSYVANVNIINNSLQFWNSNGGLNGPILLQTNLNTGQNTIAGASVLNVLIMNNNIQNNIYYPAAGVWLFAGSNSTINAKVLDNVSQNNLYGMVFQAQGAATINITANGNNSSNNINQGFYISAVGSAQANLVLCNNTIENNGAEGIIVNSSLAWGNSTSQNEVSITALINDNLIKSNTNAGINFAPQNGTVSSKLTFENNQLLRNGTSNSYSFYVANGVTSGSSSSSTTMFMNGNINDSGYGLANFNTSPYTFNIEKNGVNTGTITFIDGIYNVVERHTAAP